MYFTDIFEKEERKLINLYLSIIKNISRLVEYAFFIFKIIIYLRGLLKLRIFFLTDLTDFAD